MKTRLFGILLITFLLASCQSNDSSDNGNDSPSNDTEAENIDFSDIDLGSGEIAGTLSIEKANDESQITGYTLYWGSDQTTKIDSNALIAEFETTGSDLQHLFSPDTVIPSGAQYFLVFTKNGDTESAESIHLAVTDKTETEYSSTEGSTSSPVVLTAGTYNKEIGQGVSYYQYNPCCTFTTVDIYQLDDDLDLIKYSDASFDGIDSQSSRGRLKSETITGDASMMYFAVDGTKSGYKLNGKGSSFEMRLFSHNGSLTMYDNEGNTSNPKDISADIRDQFYYRGQTASDGTSYYVSSVEAGSRYTINVPTANKTETVYKDQFITSVTSPYTPNSDSLYISVYGASQGLFKLELLTAEGNKTFPIYLHTGRDNYCQVNDKSSYYHFEVDNSSSYTASVSNIQTDNDVDLFVYNGSTFSSLAGSSENSGTLDESVTFTTASGVVTIRIDDDSNNGASFILNLSKN